MRLGIFDSGRGGEFVAKKLTTLSPNHEYIVVNDQAHAPYGERPYEEIRQLTETAIAPLIKECEVIIIACNTATAAAIDYLREKYPTKTFVGFEPMIKPASEITTTGHITLLATKATATSARTEHLINTFGPNLTIDHLPTFGWARAIDENRSDEISLDDVEKSIEAGSDVIVIGCTHYIALIPRLARLFPDATILEPTDAVAKQLERVL